MKSIFADMLFTRLRLIAVSLIVLPAMASREMAYTYEEVKRLKRESPELVAAYLKGMAEGIFTFRVIESGVYTFCPPQGTKIDSELIELVATNEVRLHGANSGEWYQSLVRKGMTRAFPCTE